MLVSKFRLFEGPICCKEETINNIIKAACVLHNYTRIKQEYFLILKYLTHNNKIDKFRLKKIMRDKEDRYLEAQQNRERLCEYFMTPAGSIPCQWNTII